MHYTLRTAIQQSSGSERPQSSRTGHFADEQRHGRLFWHHSKPQSLVATEILSATAVHPLRSRDSPWLLECPAPSTSNLPSGIRVSQSARNRGGLHSLRVLRACCGRSSAFLVYIVSWISCIRCGRGPVTRTRHREDERMPGGRPAWTGRRQCSVPASSSPLA